MKEINGGSRKGNKIDISHECNQEKGRERERMKYASEKRQMEQTGGGKRCLVVLP